MGSVNCSCEQNGAWTNTALSLIVRQWAKQIELHGSRTPSSTTNHQWLRVHGYAAAPKFLEEGHSSNLVAHNEWNRSYCLYTARAHVHAVMLNVPISLGQTGMLLPRWPWPNWDVNAPYKPGTVQWSVRQSPVVLLLFCPLVHATWSHRFITIDVSHFNGNTEKTAPAARGKLSGQICSMDGAEHSENVWNIPPPNHCFQFQWKYSRNCPCLLWETYRYELVSIMFLTLETRLTYHPLTRQPMLPTAA